MKHGFQNILNAKYIDNKDILILNNELIYYDPRSKQLIIIPIGFESDGASIPQFMWSIVGHPFQKNVRPAAILHDYLYRNKLFTRKRCDQIFYDAMRYETVSYFKAQSFYISVRNFGKLSYKK
jgi:hypothetical protein